MGFALVDHSRRYLLSGWADRLSASISRELARGNRCEVELAGPVSSPAPPPPPVNARTLLTHAAGSGPAHWSADGYLSAVARTGPDVVWPLEEGGPPASCIGTGAQRFVATDASVADVGARQAFSIAGWCCIADAASDPDVEIVRKLSGQGAQASGYRLSYARATAALTVAVAHAGATGPSGSWTATATLADECWRHYAVVYGSDALDVWVDGVRVLRQTAGIGFDRSLAATSGLALGDAQMATGIDDWAFWRRKLTDTEIRNLYAARPGRSGFDFRALLASGRPRGVVSFDTGTVAPAIGTADLPAGMAAALPAANLPLPAVGSRSAGVPYSWAAWLRVDWIPRSAYDVRLAKNDGAVTVGVATPVRGRSRGNALGAALSGGGFQFAAEVVVTYRGGATSRWQRVGVTSAGVLRFESDAAAPAAEKAAYALVLVRLDDDGAAAFTRVRDLAATTRTGRVTQWPADTQLRDDVTAQRALAGTWSVLVVDHDVAHFDAHTLVWQPEETAPVPIWRRGGAAGQSMEVQYRPRASAAGRHQHALRTGSLPVPSRSSPVRYARDGVAFALGASGVTLLTGDSSDVILGSAAGRDPVAITRITAAADALTIDLGGGLHAGDAGHYAFLAVNARDGATFVFRFSADTSSPPSSDPYRIPLRGVGSALRAASHLANRWRLLVVDTSFAGLDTTAWTWQDGGVPHTFAVRLTGPSVDGVTGAVEAEAGVQDDGAWHHVAWSLTEDGLRLWLGGTQMPKVPVRLAGSIWTGAQPVGEEAATRLLALGVSAPGDGTFAGRNGAFVLEPANAAETLALPDTDGPSRYVHRLHVSFTSDTVTTVYIGLALLRTAGAENARANLSSEAVNAYRVYVRVRRAGMRDAVLSADLSADANIATPYVVAADTPDDFSFRSRAGAVFDVAVVDKRTKFGFDETAETVPGAGLDLHEVDYDVTTTLTRVPFHASNAPAAASASPLRAVFRATASVGANGDVALAPASTLHLPDGTTRSMNNLGFGGRSRTLGFDLLGNPVASGALRNYRLVLSRVPGVGGSRTFHVWDCAVAAQTNNAFVWTVSDFDALMREFTAGAQVDVAVFDTTYRRDRADGYVDDWTAPRVETAAVGDGVLVGRARSVGAIDELADWTRAVDSREWAAQVDARPVERVFGGLLAAPEQRRAEDGRRRVSLRLRSFAAQLEDVRRGYWLRPNRFLVDSMSLLGSGHRMLPRFADFPWKHLPQPITLDRVAPAVRPLTFGPANLAYQSHAEILDRVAEEWNLLWAVDDYGALTMMRARDVRAAVVLDDTGDVERAPRLVWDRRHLRTRQTVFGAPVEGRIVETFTGRSHSYSLTEPRRTEQWGTVRGWDDGKRLDGARRAFALYPHFAKVTSVKVRRGSSGSLVQQFGEGYTGSRRWFWDPGAVNQLTQAGTEPVLQPADTLTINGVTSRESRGQSESQTADVYGHVMAVERDPSLREDLVDHRARVLLAANDRIALRGDVRLRLGTHRGLREGMGVRLAGVPGVDERVVFLIAGVGQEIVPAAGAGPALIRTTLALQADDVPVTGAAPQETFAGRYRRLPPVDPLAPAANVVDPAALKMDAGTRVGGYLLTINAEATALRGVPETNVGGYLGSLATLPATTGYADGAIVNMAGTEYEKVPDTADPHVASGPVTDLGGGYHGNSTFSWNSGIDTVERYRANLSKAAVGTSPASRIAGQYQSSSGEYVDLVFDRDAANDTNTTYRYRATATGTSIGDDSDDAAGFTIRFFAYDSARNPPFGAALKVHAASRWELLDRHLTRTIRDVIDAEIPPRTRIPDFDAGDAGQVPTVDQAGSGLVISAAPGLTQDQVDARIAARIPDRRLLPVFGASDAGEIVRVATGGTNTEWAAAGVAPGQAYAMVRGDLIATTNALPTGALADRATFPVSSVSFVKTAGQPLARPYYVNPNTGAQIDLPMIIPADGVIGHFLVSEVGGTEVAEMFLGWGTEFETFLTTRRSTGPNYNDGSSVRVEQYSTAALLGTKNNNVFGIIVRSANIAQSANTKLKLYLARIRNTPGPAGPAGADGATFVPISSLPASPAVGTAYRLLNSITILGRGEIDVGVSVSGLQRGFLSGVTPRVGALTDAPANGIAALYASKVTSPAAVANKLILQVASDNAKIPRTVTIQRAGMASQDFTAASLGSALRHFHALTGTGADGSYLDGVDSAGIQVTYADGSKAYPDLSGRAGWKIEATGTRYVRIGFTVEDAIERVEPWATKASQIRIAAAKDLNVTMTQAQYDAALAAGTLIPGTYVFITS